MAQQQKLEQVFQLLLSEDSEQANELLHQFIVETARALYEDIVNEEFGEESDDSDVVGGDPDTDFTDEISSDEDDIDTDELNDGEADGEFDGEEELSTEEKVEDLESQLAALRAEFDALMGEELQEPQHADMAADFADDGEFDGGNEFDVVDDEEEIVSASMYEKKKDDKLEKAPEKKDAKKDKKVDEETKFLDKVADTGQKGKAKLVGTGKNSPLGAEQDKSPYTTIPPRKDYGGEPTKFGGGSKADGDYGKYHGDSAKDDTPTDNVDVKPKNSSVKADTTAKYTGGKTAGGEFNKSPLTKKPS